MVEEERGGEGLPELLRQLFGDGGGASSNCSSLGAEREWRVRGKEEETLAINRPWSQRG